MKTNQRQKPTAKSVPNDTIDWHKIIVEGINKSFTVGSKSVHVLHDVAFSIDRNDFVILFGPSGCGKSTILHILIGLEVPDTGKVTVFGEDLYSGGEDRRSSYRKKKVGIIYQQPYWIKSLNVVENVAFPLALRGVPRETTLARAMEQLKRVGMQKWAKYNPSELSSGQQQKISLARALVTDPEIIVADEPTGNLDYKSGLGLMKLLQDLRNAGKTIILITHDLGLLTFATKIIHVFDGRIDRISDTSSESINLITEGSKSLALPKSFESISLESEEDTEEVNIDKPKKRRSVKEIATGAVFLATILIKSLWFLFSLIIYLLIKLPQPESFRNLWRKIISKGETISQEYFVDYSLKNFRHQKLRTLVTIGGMSIGVGAVVFLVSIGFGLERLVISRVATFKETHQVEGTPAVASNIKITDDMLSTINKVQGVANTLPVISAVAKVNYSNANSSAAVYGVLPEYIRESSISPKVGDNLSETYSTKDDVLEIKNEKGAQDADFVNNADIRTIAVTPRTKRQVLVNDSFLSLIGLNRGNAIGKEVSLTFLLTKDLLGDTARVSSTAIPYLIAGIVEDTQNPVLYIHIDDLTQLGTKYYSQARIIARSEKDLPEIRKKLEGLGLKTTSLVDTISQIETIFRNARLLFGVVGLIAMAVACLGMFNTLTVSLLERSKEVGLMKAIGMQSSEVQSLFLTESMLMGIGGGVGGLLGGYLVGKLLSQVITVVASKSGAVGTFEVTYVPAYFVLFIIVLSVIVGVITGILPAYRSTKISALDALRYE